jgi:hypothetical protein
MHAAPPEAPRHSRRTARWWGLGVTAVLLLGVVASCGDDDDGSNAQDEVCEARSDLREAVNEVVSDVQSGNFGEARDGVDDIGEAFDELQASLQNLSQEQRDALQPDVDAISSEVQSLQDASSLEQLETSIESILGGVQTIFDNVTDSLQCT